MPHYPIHRFKAKNEYAIHSPFIFDYYKNTVQNKRKYKVYNSIESLQEFSNTQKKTGRLLFRTIEYFNIKTVFDIGNSSSPLLPYITCKYQFVSEKDAYIDKNSIITDDYTLILLNEDTTLIEPFENILHILSSNTIIILEKPHANKIRNLVWKNFKKNTDIKVSIDLFSVGILFLKKELSKQDFKLIF